MPPGLSAQRALRTLLALTLVACGADPPGKFGSHGGAIDAMTYENPVLPGDFPDPSVIRAGHAYWATATSADWAPLFPLLRSADLVNWEMFGAVFVRPPAWATSEFWAPDIREDNGRFYVFYTARKPLGPHCIAVATAAAPGGPYEDHGPLLCQPDGSIDPFSTRDENGVRYLVWKEDGNSVGAKTPIWAQALSEDGTRLVGPRTELFRNDTPWEDGVVEAPSILKHGSYVYMFYSGGVCCGRDCTYALGVARATSLLGPWEKDPANPILAGNTAWKCPGHGGLATTEDGRTFLLYHAYSAKDSVAVGRQGMLDEVVFGADGWPTINAGQGPSTSAPAPIAPGARCPPAFVDEFTGPALDAGWIWPVGWAPRSAIDPRIGGRLVLAAMPDVPGDPIGAVLARRTQSGDYEATAQVAPEPGVSAGLAAIGDPDNAIGVSVGDGQVALFRLDRGTKRVIHAALAPASLSLRMTVASGHLFRFAVSASGAVWDPLGPLIDSRSKGSDLPRWDTGVRVGLFATGPRGAAARFERFRLILSTSTP